jgi:hypothetical protein
MTANILWAIEFLLESLGAYYAFRRKLIPLSVYLGFRAVADVATFGFLLFAGQGTAYWADFWLRTAAYILFWALSMFMVAKIMREDQHTAKFYCGMALLFGAVAVLYFHAQPLTMHRIWGFELWADIIAAALVCTAMGMQERAGRTIPAPFGMLALGIAVHSLSDGLLCAAQYHGNDLTAWYPLGAVSALGIWIIAAESGELRMWLAKLFAGRRQHMKDATATIDRLIASTANNSYGKAQRIMARRIIEELRRTQ